MGNWRDQEIDRHPFEMPIRLQAGQLSYSCCDWSLSLVSSVELLDQTKHNVLGRYVNDRECIGLGRHSEKHSSNYKFNNIAQLCSMRSFHAPTDCFHCRHFSSPAAIPHLVAMISDVLTDTLRKKSQGSGRV